MERTSRKLYYVGPAMPSGKHAFDTEKTLSEDAKRIESFMEKVLQTKGPHSMLFVRIFANINRPVLFMGLDIVWVYLVAH